MTATDGAKPVYIEVLWFDGCPHARIAIRMAQRVAERLGPDVSVDLVNVDSPEKAAELRFLGSPSILVNGLDIEGRTTTQGRLACRTYEGGSGEPPEWLVEAAVLKALAPRGILFLCVANSARSQMAEGIARALAPPGVKVWSAGSAPTHVRPEAVAALADIGIDISGQRSKAVSTIPVAQVDTIITLCDEEQCPVVPGRARRLHWALADPAGGNVPKADTLDAFRQTRDELKRRLAVVFGRSALSFP